MKSRHDAAARAFGSLLSLVVIPGQRHPHDVTRVFGGVLVGFAEEKQQKKRTFLGKMVGVLPYPGKEKQEQVRDGR